MRLLPLGATHAPFGLHVVLDETGGARGPWARLSDVDDLSRVHLAAIKGDGDTILELCALKLIPDASPEGDGASPSPATNRELEDRWAGEAARLGALRAVSPHFPRMLRVEAGDGESSPRLPPLLYSAAGRALFVPPCPRCRGPLSLCRDEAWLAGAGLPSYASTRERFLWCGTCARGPEPPPVYTASTAGAGKPGVASAADLYGELVRAIQGTWSEGDASALVGAATVKAVRSLRPGDDAAREAFTPLTFYGSPYLLTVAAPLDLDALADALGGRPLEELGAPASPGGGAVPPRWAWLARTPEPSRRTLFPAESSGLDAAEVFFLKLTAFRQILEGLIDFTRATGRPHLDLHPRHILFDLSGAGDELPLFWTFQVRLHGLAAASQTLLAPGSPSVVLPGPGLSVPYAAPEIQEFRLAGFRPAEVVLSELGEEGSASRRFRLKGRLLDAYGLYPAPQARDAIFLSLPDPALGFGFTGLSVRAVPGSIRADEALFASDLLELDEGGLKRLRLALGTKLPGARYRVFPDFGTPTDLHALGVALLRLLLRNDGQDLGDVLHAVERLSREIAGGLGDTRRDVGLPALLKRVPEVAPVFSKTQLLWAADDRRTDRPNAVPDRLWERAVLLALRLVTRTAGFSVAAGPADFDPLFRDEKLERILPEVASILAELQALLLERQSVHIEIQQVLAEVLDLERIPGGRS